MRRRREERVSVCDQQRTAAVRTHEMSDVQIYFVPFGSGTQYRAYWSGLADVCC